MADFYPFRPQPDNHYQINDLPWNILIDNVMPALKPNSWKVLCFILRKTLGWNKEADKLSYSQIRNGITNKSASDTTIKTALTELQETGYIVADVSAEKSAPYYSPNPDFTIQSTTKMIVDDKETDTTKTVVDEKSTTKIVEPEKKSTTKIVEPEKKSTTKIVDTKVVLLLQDPDKLFSTIYQRWCAEFGDMGQSVIWLLGDYIDDEKCENEWIWQAFQITLTHKPDAPWAYMKKILDTWIQEDGPPPIEVKNKASPKRASNGLKPPKIDRQRLERLKQLQQEDAV